MLQRSQALQIYLKPGLKEDDLMLRVWEACRKSGRPQHVFRTMLRAGLIAMVESGDMPESVIEECGLDSLVERRRRRVTRHSDKPQAAPQPEAYPAPPQYPPQYAPYPAYPPQYPHREPTAYAPQPHPAPAAPAGYYEEERRPPPPVEAPVPREEARVLAPPPPQPEPVQERPIAANPSVSDGETRPQRKLGKLM
ncbi:hypothetical protein D3C71_153640 [compost metagenome]